MGKEGTAKEGTAPSPARVASIVEHRSEPAFVLLLQLADRHFADPGFEGALARSLGENPPWIELWEAWSGNQRWTPSVYVEAAEVGWFDGVRRNVRIHPDRGAAVADFIQRLAARLSRREVLDVEAQPWNPRACAARRASPLLAGDTGSADERSARARRSYWYQP